MEQSLRIGIPVAAQGGLIQIVFILITVIANGRGLTDSAAGGIVEKNHLVSVSGTIVHAVHCVRAWGAVHWCRQA